MEFDRLVAQMAEDARRIKSLVEGVSLEQARWRPTAEDWSLLEVLVHLLDEEREDFRVRLDIILHRPDEPWPPIDPGGWVAEREYNKHDLGETLESFMQERLKSLNWLRGLNAPNWEAESEAPFGVMTAGDIFAAWVAHDLLHTRQLVELHWAYLQTLAEPFRVEYAGYWE
jgi:hypothetical protein